MKIRKWQKYIIVFFLFVAIIGYFYLIFPFWGMPFNAQRHGNPPLTPAWALECWLWEDDENTAATVDELLEGYAKHDIPVRTILLDSPWSLRYNDFEVDEKLYPEPATWFAKLQNQGYRVVLWMTPMVNSFNKGLALENSKPWYEEARANGYLAADGDQIKWWKGKGGFVDYTNPAAVEWWRSLQQKVFDYGIDGWKLDGSATLFYSQLGPLPLFYKTTSKGLMTTRKYMDHYYRDEYQHGLTQNPEFVTLARALDRGYHPEGFAPLDAAPVTWVGDQRHTWESGSTGSDGQGDTIDLVMDGIEGIEMAIENVLNSAERGYNIIGSDVAGFSGRYIPPRLYIRWAQFSTFCGLFLNGGHGERALWKRSNQELEIIREFSWLHTELIPYMYTYVVEAHHGGRVLQKPVEGKYHYLFGHDFLIAPIYKDDLENEVSLPEGQWRYWFDDKEIIEGPVSFKRAFPLDEYPVFIREGAIVPLQVERSYTGLGDEDSKEFLTLAIYPQGKNEFTVHHPDGSGSTHVIVEEHLETLNIQLLENSEPHILRIHLSSKPKSVLLDGSELIENKHYLYDNVQAKLVITTVNYKNGSYTISK